MDARLVSLGVPHVSHLYVGYHDWPFWRQRLGVALPVITAGFTRAEQTLAQKP
jgi:S-formylglutathione hydrolase FrmB